MNRLFAYIMYAPCTTTTTHLCKAALHYCIYQLCRV